MLRSGERYFFVWVTLPGVVAFVGGKWLDMLFNKLQVLLCSLVSWRMTSTFITLRNTTECLLSFQNMAQSSIRDSMDPEKCPSCRWSQIHPHYWRRKPLSDFYNFQLYSAVLQQPVWHSRRYRRFEHQRIQVAKTHRTASFAFLRWVSRSILVHIHMTGGQGLSQVPNIKFNNSIGV